MVEAVIDASVLVKWFIREEHSDKALLLRDKHVNGELRLVAPTLITYETLNALRYSGLFSIGELKDIARSIRNYALSFRELDQEASELAIDAAEKNGVTFYDACYLGLAYRLKAEFITADKAFVARLKGEYARSAKLLWQT